MNLEIPSARDWLFATAASEITFALLVRRNPDDTAESGRSEGRLWGESGQNDKADRYCKTRGPTPGGECSCSLIALKATLQRIADSGCALCA